MATKNVALGFIEDIIIGFGFFSGFWIAIGIDPQDLLVNSILDAFKPLVGSMASTLGFYYWLFGILSILFSISLAYVIGKWVGLLAVLFAFIGGLLFTSVGVYLLLFGVFLGFIAPFTKGK
jgi:hypothetical protein